MIDRIVLSLEKFYSGNASLLILVPVSSAFFHLFSSHADAIQSNRDAVERIPEIRENVISATSAQTDRELGLVLREFKLFESLLSTQFDGVETSQNAMINAFVELDGRISSTFFEIDSRLASLEAASSQIGEDVSVRIKGELNDFCKRQGWEDRQLIIELRFNRESVNSMIRRLTNATDQEVYYSRICGRNILYSDIDAEKNIVIGELYNDLLVALSAIDAPLYSAEVRLE